MRPRSLPGRSRRVRDQLKQQAVKQELSNCTGQGSFDFIQLELGSLQAVKEGADAFLRRSKQLNILIANAGDNAACAELQSVFGTCGTDWRPDMPRCFIGQFVCTCTQHLLAGVMACPESTTKDGFETQFGVNYLAHFYLFQLLKSTLLASSTPSFQSRVVTVASNAHHFSKFHVDDLNMKKRGYNMLGAYGQVVSSIVCWGESMILPQL